MYQWGGIQKMCAGLRRFGNGVIVLSVLASGVATAGPSATGTVAEFYNTNLDNYFITADANEAAAIDNGSAGPGWSRTGYTFNSGGSTPVCRFYGSPSPGPNSHFYTVDAAECQSLKDQQIPAGDPRKLTVKSWNYESLDFVSTPATNQTCPSGTTPVYRAYNNGFARGVDSNHRITSSQTAIQQVVARGWNNEGVVMCAPGNTVTTSNLNDTGITAGQCYQAGSNVLVACSSAGAIALNNAQDGMVGRDANAATNSNIDGKLGFSFASVTGGCVQDNVTGLMWEVKTADGGLRDWNKTYSNYSATYPSNLYGTATDASGFVNAVNATNLCGYNDWRLPSADELQSIVDYGVAYPGPTIDATWFPHTQGSVFWSSSPYVGYSDYAWYVSFLSGSVSYGYRNDSYYVRLVRAGQSPTLPRYTVSADGQEVTDNQTQLVWRRCAEGMTFSGGACTGTAVTFTHEAALQRAAAQAGSTGVAWRLPNIKELASIADRSSYPAIDPTAFPVTPADWFWSSSPYVGTDRAWYVNFGYGYVSNGGRSGNYVRLVRAGQ